MSDVAYMATRRHGKPAVVVIVGGADVNLETGEKSLETTTHNVRWVVKEPTSYGRIVKAQAAQQDVGSTTFIFWSRDITFTRLDTEDYVIAEGIKHQVVSSQLEDTSLVITAREIVGVPGEQRVTVSVENEIGMSQTVSDE